MDISYEQFKWLLRLICLDVQIVAHCDYLFKLHLSKFLLTYIKYQFTVSCSREAAILNLTTTYGVTSLSKIFSGLSPRQRQILQREKYWRKILIMELRYRTANGERERDLIIVDGKIVKKKDTRNWNRVDLSNAFILMQTVLFPKWMS